jgi:hypothetical protein
MSRVQPVIQPAETSVRACNRDLEPHGTPASLRLDDGPTDDASPVLWLQPDLLTRPATGPGGQYPLTRSSVSHTNIPSNIGPEPARMDTAQAFGFEDLFRFAVSDLAKAVSERNGEDETRQFARCQAAAHMITGFLPRDVIEVMLAGHCVLLHEAMKGEIHDSLQAESGTNRRTLIGLNKAFNDDLDRLQRYRQRPADDSRDAPEAPPAAAASAAPDILLPPVAGARATPAGSPVASAGPATLPAAQEMNRAARRQAARAEKRAAAASRAASRQAAALPAGPPGDALPQAAHRVDGTPAAPRTHETVDKCRANPEAMTALAAGDPHRFARALGFDAPGAAFLAAAKTNGSPFDPQASGPWPMGQLSAARVA